MCVLPGVPASLQFSSPSSLAPLFHPEFSIRGKEGSSGWQQHAAPSVMQLLRFCTATVLPVSSFPCCWVGGDGEEEAKGVSSATAWKEGLQADSLPVNSEITHRVSSETAERSLDHRIQDHSKGLWAHLLQLCDTHAMSSLHFPGASPLEAVWPQPLAVILDELRPPHHYPFMLIGMSPPVPFPPFTAAVPSWPPESLLPCSNWLHREGSARDSGNGGGFFSMPGPPGYSQTVWEKAQGRAYLLLLSLAQQDRSSFGAPSVPGSVGNSGCDKQIEGTWGRRGHVAEHGGKGNK